MSIRINANGKTPWRPLMVFALAVVVNGPATAETAPPAGEERVINVHDEGMVTDDHAFSNSDILTLFFATGRSVLGPEARRALDQVAPQILDHLAAGGRVVIDGHADIMGRPDETHSLSSRRAEGVAAYLYEAWGIPTRRLILRAWGTTLPEGYETPRTAENRRVVLTLHERHLTARPHGAVPRLTVLRPLRPNHLDLDDFGGARNPLLGPQIRIWPVPDPSRN